MAYLSCVNFTWDIKNKRYLTSACQRRGLFHCGTRLEAAVDLTLEVSKQSYIWIILSVCVCVTKGLIRCAMSRAVYDGYRYLYV